MRQLKLIYLLTGMILIQSTHGVSFAETPNTLHEAESLRDTVRKAYSSLKEISEYYDTVGKLNRIPGKIGQKQYDLAFINDSKCTDRIRGYALIIAALPQSSEFELNDFCDKETISPKFLTYKIQKTSFIWHKLKAWDSKLEFHITLTNCHSRSDVIRNLKGLTRRMYVLAVLSANGVYTAEDREQINFEFEALKIELSMWHRYMNQGTEKQLLIITDIKSVKSAQESLALLAVLEQSI